MLIDVQGSPNTFGNTKATSSNFPLLLQFSAIGDLDSVRNMIPIERCDFTILPHCLSQSAVLEFALVKSSIPIAEAMSPNDGCRVLLQSRDYHRCRACHVGLPESKAAEECKC